MEKLFDSVTALDRQAESLFNLKCGVLMENAARGMAVHIRDFLAQQQHTNRKPVVQIICGSGDNGGDGYALARMLTDFCSVYTIEVKTPKSPLCRLQRERLELLHIPIYKECADSCDILVDAIFGTGLEGELNEDMRLLIDRLNGINAHKIACDIPSGLNEKGVPAPCAFHADETCTMGALKTALYADTAKDYTGTIQLINLGLPRQCYEGNTDTFLLSSTDMHIPHRRLQNTHKMHYGHSLFFCGEKTGACILASSAALRFGSGVVSILGEPLSAALPDVMYTAEIPEYLSAFSIGSGLGRSPEQQAKALCILKQNPVQNIPIILDADILHCKELPVLLHSLKQPILTPHPKEFQSLLSYSGLAEVSIQEIQKNRFFYLRLFSSHFPHAVIVLKGAYPLIGQNGTIYVNPLGTNALAKAGTGDVLGGMITALAAQGYSLLDAACTASLAHAKAAGSVNTNYGLLASDILLHIAHLTK